MDIGSRDWMLLPRFTADYISGVHGFLDKAFASSIKQNIICCPCKKCGFRYWYPRDIVYDHLIVVGFTTRYTQWYFHGEELESEINADKTSTDTDEMAEQNTVDSLLHATFRDVVKKYNGESEFRGDSNVEAKKYFRLLEEGKQELYPGCKSFSKLSFTIRLYHLKCLHGISNVAFTDLLELPKEVFSDAKLPSSSNGAKKIVKDLGLNYEKIHSCPNDCILYWGDNKQLDSCHICGTSKWKNNKNVEDNSRKKGIPAKVFRYFPLKPRLQRLFMCSGLSNNMLWHARERPTDGNLRHPADGKAWKDFNTRYPDFALEPRNVSLGLATDGFNPFRTMSFSYSTWPVILIVYNLPPYNCTKPENLILSSIIPGPSSPRNNIDIYLQPLIKELKELWDNGIETYDAASNQSFKLRAALLWTVSDFPAYAMLRGWTTKGKFACPVCNYDTCFQYLKHSKKMCYMNHRRFLDAKHPWRHEKRSFNGEVELRAAPEPLSNSDVLHLLADYENEFGKKKKRQKVSSDNPWRKKSIFFDLSYWPFNLCCHMLDVMHIEKNVCDNILGTLLDIQGKTKDHLNARLDLKSMGIRKELHPIPSNEKSSRRVSLAKACFSMTTKEKSVFFSVLRDAKLPQGCASNISRCVDISGNKISGYKSHDAHFIMQYLLQVAVKKSLPKHVAIALIRLSSFFRNICSKVVKQKDLELLESEIAETLCQLEKIFPPSFNVEVPS